MRRLCFVLAFIITFILSSCAIEKMAELLSDGRKVKAPEWNLDYELPILKKEIKMSDFVDVGAFLKDLQHRDEESIEEKKNGLIYMQLDPIEITTEDLNIDSNVKKLLGDNKEPLTWPLPIQIFQTPKIIETSFPSIRMDLDKDNIDDLILDRLQSRDGYLKIGAKITITDENNVKHDAEKEEYFVEGFPVFKISEIIISDKKFFFEEATFDEEEKCLVFTPTGFLSDWNSPLTPSKKDPDDPNCIDYVFKFKLPENSLSVRGKGFEFIDNLIETAMNEEAESKRNTILRNSRRSRTTFSLADIKEMITENGGGVKGLETLMEDEGLEVKDIADAYQNENQGINDLLKDMGDVPIADVLSSELISENIEDLTELVQDYDLGDGKTLKDVADAGNLAGLGDFINFHKKHAIKKLEIVFSVEINLGDSFIIVGKFIHDFTAISLKNNELELPLSNMGNMLKDIKINADINNTFSFPVELKNAYLNDSKGNKIPILFDGKEGDFQLTPNTRQMHELDFFKPITELGDSSLLLDVIIPKGSECTVSLSTDFMLDMNIIATGYAAVETNSTEK